MKLIHILVIAGIAALSMSACSKIKQAKNMLSNADVVTHFGFHEKSYWVYSDALTGSVDSFVIVGYKNKINVSNITDGTDIDDVSLCIADYNSEANAVDTFNWRVALGVNTVSLFIDDPKVGDHGYSGTLFCYPFKKGFYETLLGGNDVAYSAITNVYSSYVVNGTSYYNVAEINLYAGNTIAGYPYAKNDFIYISADAGVIKMNIDHPQATLKKNWEVLRYKLVF